MKDMTKLIGNEWKQHTYYAEAEGWLEQFWGENTPFYKAFNKLDCEHIVELACGHGGHVQKYADKAKSIALVDINAENIEHCKKRFDNMNNITFIVNSGCDFKEIETSSKTSIICYDAMVHFELMDVNSYLSDSYRILKNGGRLLFHHSNACFAPGEHYGNKPHARNFMSADIFTHLAVRAGFKVLSQEIFAWGTINDLDCLTLCEKSY